MSEIGRWMMLAGIAIAVVGALVWMAGKAGFRGMPGDIRIENEGVRFYFPIVTSIVISGALTLGVWIWRWWGGR